MRRQDLDICLFVTKVNEIKKFDEHTVEEEIIIKKKYSTNSISKAFKFV